LQRKRYKEKCLHIVKYDPDQLRRNVNGHCNRKDNPT
jgi:hypothetical protein